MKALLLTTHLEVGGIPVYVIALARGLKRNGHLPSVASSGGWLLSRLKEEEIPHWKIPCRTSSELNPKLWFLALPRLLWIVWRERPDLIHAHTRVTQVLAWILHLLTRVPYVTTCHGLYRYRIGRRIFRCWGRWAMAISVPTMERMVQQYKLAPPHRVILVLNGIELERFLVPPSQQQVSRFRETLGLRGHPVVGAIARFSPVKGLECILKAVAGLLSEYPQLQVLLVGDGPSRSRLIELAYRLGIEERVVMSHPVEDTRIPLACMDCFVAPAYQEGFGLAIVEAMAAGVPVVATNVGGPLDFVREGKTGYLIPPGDPQAIEQALRKLLSDPDRRLKMGREAREQAQERFDMKRVVKEVEAVYSRALPASAYAR